MGAKPQPPPPAPQPVAVLGRRPQIARSMRLRLALLVVTLLVSPALTGGAMLVGQEASPYVPIGHWATPYLEHLIAAGVIDDPSPLTRPLRRSDVLRALETVDTLRLSRPTLATVRRLKAARAWLRPTTPAATRSRRSTQSARAGPDPGTAQPTRTWIWHSSRATWSR